MTTTSKKEIPKLHEAFAGQFRIGAAVNPFTLQKQRELLAQHFNSITAENEMKFESVHPEEDRYTFDQADRLFAFADEHGMGVRGHTLVWHNQTPSWVFQNSDGSSTDAKTLLNRMREHINTVAGRYKGRVYAWDVVNEAVSDSADSLLRPSRWLDIAGEEFIARAFEYAHAADPQAQLFYNDYNESDPGKRERIYSLVKGLKDKDVPIHGIGLQAHWSVAHPTLDEIRAAIERYAELDVRLHVTEMDVSVFGFDDRRTDLTAPPAELMELQAERYEAFFRIFKEYSGVIDSVTFWGAADDYTWLDGFPVRNRKNWPLPFDTNHNPKDSYWRMLDIARS
jgi:endo-1,4-beta-xylanase